MKQYARIEKASSAEVCSNPQPCRLNEVRAGEVRSASRRAECQEISIGTAIRETLDTARSPECHADEKATPGAVILSIPRTQRVRAALEWEVPRLGADCRLLRRAARTLRVRECAKTAKSV